MTDTFIRVEGGKPNIAYVNVRYVERIWVQAMPDNPQSFAVRLRQHGDRNAYSSLDMTVKRDFDSLDKAENFIKAVLHV